MTATFADRQITTGDTSVLTFAIANSTGNVLTRLGFTQPMPKNLDVTGYMLRKNCGRAVVSGVRAVRASLLEVAPEAVCTVEVIVATRAEGVFEVSPENNATVTGNLIPGQGDELRVRSAPACTSPVALLCPPGG